MRVETNDVYRLWKEKVLNARKVKAAAAADAGGNDNGKGAAVGADENVQNAPSLGPKLDDA